jgi:hypothetical protein
MGWNGPVAINHLAVHAAMELYEVEDKKDCFEKVLKLSYHFIAEARED